LSGITLNEKNGRQLLLRLTEEEKQIFIDARRKLRKSYKEIILTAVFEYYLPDVYEKKAVEL